MSPGTVPTDSGPPPGRSPGRLRPRLLRLLVVLLVSAVSLVAAEYATRFVFRHARSSGRAGDFVATRGGGPAIVTNQLGFREREIPPARPDRYRIAVVGDSFTWGQGIEPGERYSNLLEGLLGPR